MAILEMIGCFFNPFKNSFWLGFSPTPKTSELHEPLIFIAPAKFPQRETYAKKGLQNPNMPEKAAVLLRSTSLHLLRSPTEDCFHFDQKPATSMGRHADAEGAP